MMVIPNQSEINEVLNWCAEGEDEGSHFPAMSYEEGVRAGIEWVRGDTDERPDAE